MAYNGSSAMDAHKYYGGSGTFADRRKTWVDLGLGDASSYQGTAAQNGQLISAMNSYGGLTRPVTQTPAAQTATPAPVSNTTSSPAAGSAPSSSSGQSSVAALRSNSDALQQQLAALVPYDNSQLMSITQNYANQRNALGPYDDSAAQKIYQAYMNQRNAMGPFRYNYANDPVYQAYAAQYQRDGRRAMEDTLGQLASRTGGLASSYAATAAQQQYDRYMTDLNNVIPQLEQIAYGRYRDAKGDLDTDLSRQLALEGLAYDRYRDRLGDLDSDYKTQLALEEVFYNRDRDLRSDIAKDLSTARSLEQTEYKNLDDLITTSGYVPTDAELYAAGMTRERANALKGVYDVAQQAAAAKAKSSGSNPGTPKKAADTASKDKVYDTVSKMKGDDDAKIKRLESYVNEGAISKDDAVEIAGWLGIDLTSNSSSSSSSELTARQKALQAFYKNKPEVLDALGIPRMTK